MTGATGFIGSNLLKGLIKHHNEIVIIKRSSSNLKNIEAFGGYFRTYNIDNISIAQIFDAEKGIDAIIHCATNYGRNHEKPSTVVNVNLIFPLALFESALNNGVKFFINTDTSLNKTNNTKGYMQKYILSKKQFLDWGKLYSMAGKINFINLVMEHIYGPGDDSSKFIAFLIESFKNNIESIDLTEGEQYRDFLYIDDAVDSYLTILSKMDKLLGYNEFEVGSGNVVKIKELVKLAKELMKSETILNFGAIKHRENEVMYSKADISDLLKLGWAPQYDYISGLKKYISSVL